MNTRQLKHLLAIVEHGTLGAAAEVVHLSIPALSRSLQALESELGVPLFDRQGGRLHLTPYGVEYVQRARRIVFEEMEGVRTLASMRAGGAGLLSFGLGSATAASVLEPMLLQLLSVNPRGRVKTVVQSSDALLTALKAEQLDFFVGDTRIANGDLELVVEPVYTCTFGWFVHKNHPLLDRPLMSFDLSGFPVICAGFTDLAMGQRIAQLYGWERPIEKQFTLITNDHPIVIRLITETDALLPTSDLTVFSLLRSGAVKRLSVMPALDLPLTLGIVRRAGRTCTPLMEWAFDYIRSHFSRVASEIEAYRSGR
jgi:DNA-binding transcriptional LysR family regulator